MHLKRKLLLSSIVLFGALLLLTVLADTGFAAPAAAEKQLPFKGTLQAVETNMVAFPTLFVDARGSGHATYLGRYTVHYQVTVNLLNGSGVASAQFVAANGDKLFAEGLGQSTPTGTLNVVTIVEKYTITGGTGRFAGASGHFTVERVLNQATGATFGTIDGTIVIPHEK